MELSGSLESILFVASKPLSVGMIARALGASDDAVALALEDLKSTYNVAQSGIHILSQGDDVLMATNPSSASVIEQFVKDEVAGELTRPQLETLTVIAYRGPITRPELEQIRGVNCAIILRNLLMRGLIDEREDASKLTEAYTLSFDALRHLGIASVEELKDYEALHAHEHVEQALEAPEHVSM